MATISVTFTGSNVDEVAQLIAAWVPPVARGVGRPVAAVALVSAGESANAIVSVLEGIHGEKSRQLLRYLADAGRKGEAVKLSESLMREFGVSSGTAVAGIIGPINRRAGRIMGRPLVAYPSADPKARIWQISRPDAEATLAALDDE
jgi:hypothetical protein